MPVPRPPPTELPTMPAKIAEVAILASTGRVGSTSYKAISITACTAPSSRNSAPPSVAVPTPILDTRSIKLSMNLVDIDVTLSPNKPCVISSPPRTLSPIMDVIKPVIPALRATEVANSSASFICVSDNGIDPTPVASAMRALRFSN